MDQAKFRFLSQKFLQAMNEIGEYGHVKYGENSFHARAEKGDKSRGSILSRTGSIAIIRHSQEHGDAYLRGELHDHFGTRRHQLAAQAYNPMMEFFFAGLEEES